jgi:hypothetical protein
MVQGRDLLDTDLELYVLMWAPFFYIEHTKGPYFIKLAIFTSLTSWPSPWGAVRAAGQTLWLGVWWVHGHAHQSRCQQLPEQTVRIRKGIRQENSLAPRVSPNQPSLRRNFLQGVIGLMPDEHKQSLASTYEPKIQFCTQVSNQSL